MVILRKPVAALSQAALVKFTTRASRAVHLRGTVNILVTSSRELQALNRRFRRQNKPTDVLSFPAMRTAMPSLAGDVAISAEIAAQNARQLGHTAAQEVKILTLHGLLHLAGYDHEKDDGEMARKERRLRKSLGLPVGLIERHGQPAGDRSRPLTAGSAKTPRSTQRRTNQKAKEHNASRSARVKRKPR